MVKIRSPQEGQYFLSSRESASKMIGPSKNVANLAEQVQLLLLDAVFFCGGLGPFPVNLAQLKNSFFRV